MHQLYELLRAIERTMLGCVSALAGGPLLGLELFPDSSLWLGGWLYWVVLCWGLARTVETLSGTRRSGGAAWMLVLECSCGLFLLLIGFSIARFHHQPAWLLLSGLGLLWFWMLIHQEQNG